MKVHSQYIKNSLDNYNYIVYDEKTKEAIIFDPFDIEQQLDFIKAQGLKIRYLLNTHHHHDHIKDSQKVCEIFGIHKKEMIHSDIVRFASGSIQCIETPGHVMDHKVYFVFDHAQTPHSVICGDTLFNAGVGNCKNGGDLESLYKTTMMLKDLIPDDTIIYPSHDYMVTNLNFAKSIDKENEYLDLYLQQREKGRFHTTFAQEKLINLFLKVDDRQLQKQLAVDNEKDAFIELRNRRDNW